MYRLERFFEVVGPPVAATILFLLSVLVVIALLNIISVNSIELLNTIRGYSQ